MGSKIKFTLLDRHSELLDAWKAAFEKYLPTALGESFTLLESDIRRAGKFDCVVSPANSYGIMDGGIDLYIAAAISPSDTTPVIRAVQKHLYTNYRGYLSAGQCTLAPLPDDLCGPSNSLGCRYIAVLPTMRLPEHIEWQRDIVYDCMWNLLLALEQHNVATQGSGKEISTVVMSGLGTGTGGISSQKCAEQMVLAVKHFREAQSKPDKWGQFDWEDVEVLDEEIGPTRKL
ncbi:macro domain-like protein [Calocera cornea HHB12733]|uniref:Macro domain-like protein n=1 Tax=Calocera cornea HHB12733 TaxID=1353952 RepID=A0A165J194_9BASI|nr:macro domain-like protein [Calocera cornea HHB12733]